MRLKCDPTVAIKWEHKIEVILKWWMGTLQKKHNMVAEL